MTQQQLTDQQLHDIEARAKASFDEHEAPEARQARWESAAWMAGRTIDRNALAVYMAVADAEQKTLADNWAQAAAAQSAYEQRLREQRDRDVAELNRLRARVWDLERPTVEAQRNEIRQSFAELAAQCRDDRDAEGAFEVECRLRKREEQWKREDAVVVPAAGVTGE